MKGQYNERTATMRVTLLIALAALVGGATGSVATLALEDRVSDSPGTSNAKAEEEEATGDEDQDALVDAGERMRTLEHRVALLSRALTARGQERSELNEAVEDGRLLPAGASDVADPVFEAAVLDIVDREQERKEEERDTWRKQLQVERSKRTAEALAQQLSLSEEERERVARVVTEYFDSFRALRESPDRPVTMREWRVKGEEMRTALERQLAQIMSPAQFQAYQDLDPEDQIGMGPGRGDRAAARPRAEGTQTASPADPN